MTNLIYREAKVSDIPSLLVIEQYVIEAEKPFNSSIRDNAHYYNIPELVDSPNSLLLVGELNHALVASGYIQIRQSKPSLTHFKHGYLGFMYVSQSMRGLGINKAIVEQLIQWGIDNHVQDFYLDAYSANSSAIKAYEKVGFQPSLLEMKLTTDKNS